MRRAGFVHVGGVGGIAGCQGFCKAHGAARQDLLSAR